MAENTQDGTIREGRVGQREVSVFVSLALALAFHWETMAWLPGQDRQVAMWPHTSHSTSLDLRFLASEIGEIELSQGWQIVSSCVPILINQQ